MLDNNQFVIFDTETTGLSPNLGDGIIEIAALRINAQGEILSEFDFFVNPRVPIAPAAEMVHGYSDSFIAQHGKPVAEIIPEFVKFSQDATLVGHNIIKFDIPFVNKHLHELSLEILTNKALDTLHLSQRKLRLQNYKLKTVAAHYDIPYIGAHKAMNDVHITKDVFLNLMNS